MFQLYLLPERLIPVRVPVRYPCAN